MKSSFHDLLGMLVNNFRTSAGVTSGMLSNCGPVWGCSSTNWGLTVNEPNLFKIESFERESRVKNHTEVANAIHRMNGITSNGDRLCGTGTKTSRWTKPNYLSPWTSWASADCWPSMSWHPPRKPPINNWRRPFHLEGRDCISGGHQRNRVFEIVVARPDGKRPLCRVRKRVVLRPSPVARRMRDDQSPTLHHCTWPVEFWKSSMFESRTSCADDSEWTGQPTQEDVMINTVECRTEVEHSEEGDQTVISCPENVGWDLEEGHSNEMLSRGSGCKFFWKWYPWGKHCYRWVARAVEGSKSNIFLSNKPVWARIPMSYANRDLDRFGNHWYISKLHWN